MRVSVTPQRIELEEETPFKVAITVTNTGDLIGGYHLRILGADPAWVRLESENLSLFPDTSQTVTATITIPRGLGAGDRRIAIQVRELTPPQAISVAEIDILVPSRQALKLSLSPMTVICGSVGRFGLVLENTGNTTVEARPIGLDPEEKIEFTFLPPVVTLAPGEHVITDLRAKAKRRWFGTPVVRAFGLAIAPDDVLAAPLIPEPGPGAGPRHRKVAGAIAPVPPKIEPLATGSMLQKARLARGAISLLSLLLAVSVFAIVITIALSRLVGVSAADRDLAIQVAAARQSNSASGTSTLGGTVKLLTDGSPAAGVAVELFDANSTASPLTSTATNDKGVWTLPSLAEGSYKLRFRGAGFAEIWYPSALTGADAKAVQLQAGQKLTNLAITLGGLPATVSGTVLGDDVAAAVLTVSIPATDLPRGGAPPTGTATLPLVTAQPVPTAGAPAVTRSTAPKTTAAATTSAPADGANGGAVVQTVPIGADGTFSVPDLPSPAVYDLTVAKAGYATATQRIDLSGGEDRKGVELRLRTGDGLISGTVTGPDGPLAGAVVTATTGKTVVTTVSLTTGAVGTFTLRGLVTPGTYTVTVTKDNFTTASSTLTLAAGQKLTGVQLSMARSSGSLTGMVTLLGTGKAAPGVSVTITTGDTTVSTVTQSTGSIGAWTVAGLPVPGAYTVTFSRADLQSQTVAVSLDATGKLTSGSGSTAGGIAVGMKSASAVISGTVTQRSANGTVQKVGQAVITLSSGTDTYTVNSASLPSSSLGRYEITGITPGTYTLSANRPGTSPTTVIVTVTAGQILLYDPVMIPPAAISGHVKSRTGGTVLGLEVDLYQASQYPAKVYRTTTTDSTGAYSFVDVDAPQAYVVEVRSSTAGSLGSATLVLAASQAAVLDLTVGAITSGTTTQGAVTTPAAPTTPTTPTSTTAGAAPAVTTPASVTPARVTSTTDTTTGTR
ncbi:Carboxypeptidase regulatory-like domain-containing protein [Nakamurella panacisegetis]|uniref:Carboxypeptidase regulatory-like domain-containing protein n=1 Tax=Nakamurella panacisegetis TaxID=1090615 RepID=A0A1H0JID6_9ACTN|nr:carboxypeptidase-like regulatory domain-containing protein [Nakamurella panacisegetis]SDO43243.1 Carboxypeptidase regulatory-like domain-containing protein [Nakamurella panacisegetis]